MDAGPRTRHDPALFEGTAWYYARYRPHYPPELFRELARRYLLDGRGRLLDLGCGTGQVAIPLASWFEDVVGIDPDGEMLGEARSAGSNAGVTNVSWVQASSWDLGPRFGEFRLVTMGESFHWMDRRTVVEILHDMVLPGGGVVVVTQTVRGLDADGATQPPYEPVVTEALTRYLGKKRRAGGSYYSHPAEPHEVVLRGSPFKSLETWTHAYQRDWTIDEIVGYLYSTSYSSKRLLGDRSAEFEREIRDRLRVIEPSGVFTTQLLVTALMVFKE